MRKRDLMFCEELAEFICYPSSFEVGGSSSRLKDIIKTITVKNVSVKKKVLEICKDRVEVGFFDSYVYDTQDTDEVMNMIQEDYDVVFFND